MSAIVWALMLLPQCSFSTPRVYVGRTMGVHTTVQAERDFSMARISLKGMGIDAHGVAHIREGRDVMLDSVFQRFLDNRGVRIFDVRLVDDTIELSVQIPFFGRRLVRLHQR